VKVYVVPAVRPEIVVLVPVPELVAPPGDLVMVHVPEEGSPLKTTLPVANEHVGCVTVPGVGAEGVGGWALIDAPPDEADVHPSELVTVNVYVVPAVSPVIVVLVPVPELVVPPGDLVIVHVPEEGNPFRMTLPVATEHVG
jgi:hypothetical protein